MSCINCEWYKTVDELYDNYFKTLDVDIECSKKIALLEKAMTHLWAYAYPLPWFKVSEIVDINATTHTTCDKIFLPLGWYGKWCNGKIIEDDSVYIQCCPNWFAPMDMRYREAVSSLGDWEYTIQCPLDDEVQYNFPKWVSAAQFTYYRYFDELVDWNSIVKIPRYLLPALSMLVAYHSPWIEPADKVSIWEDFTNFMTQLYNTFKGTHQVPSKINFTLFR